MPNTNTTQELGQIRELVESLFCDDSAVLVNDSQSLYELFVAAIDSPVDYPRLADCVFPGDRVSILLQSNLPGAAVVLDCLVQAMSASGIETEDLLVVIRNLPGES